MIYDTSTKNKSFLKMSKYLRERKIKNNKFMLALYDENIKGLDPYSKDLTPEQEIRIFRECSLNVWYFLREVIRIPADGANIPYIANIGNITFSYLRSLNKNIIMILPRQNGKTMATIAVDVWNMCFVASNANEVYLNKGKQDAIKNLKLFKDIKDLLPKWMLDNFIVDVKKDIDNQESKLLSKRNNTLRVVSPGSDPDAADKAGRGLTVSNIVFDEFAFMKYNDITYKAAIPAFSKASENAKNNGKPYGVVITTTPNNIDEGTPGCFCYNMIEDAAKWKLELFDLNENELNEYIHSNSMNDFIFVEYSYKELGKSEEWLEKQKRALANDMLTLKREVLLVWPHSTDGAVFSEDQLTRVYDYVKQPHSTLLIFNRYPVTFYEEPDLRMNYILSCDVSGGLSNDSSAISIIHPEDFHVVGDFLNSKVDTDTYRRIIEELMTLYFRKALLVVEKTGIGMGIVDALMKNPLIEPRMFREDKQHFGEKTTSSGFVVKKKTKTTIYGVDTNKQTRNQMMDLLFDIVNNEYDKIVSPNIYSNLVTLEKKRNGKIEARNGKHDDSLMSYLIFRWAVFYGTCFRDRFHISPVASRANVNIMSSDDGGISSRINSVLNTAAFSENSSYMDSSVYQSLIKQNEKLQSGEMSLSEYEEQKKKTADAFMRIANLNSD